MTADQRATFEEAEIRFCDLTAPCSPGIVIMRKARIGDEPLLRLLRRRAYTPRNIAGGRLLQQDLDAYSF